MLYEDEDGIVYFKNDNKFFNDGSYLNIRDHLKSKVWEIDSVTNLPRIKQEFINNNTVTAYEVMPVDVYYEVDRVTNTVINTHVINSLDKLQKVSDAIANGGLFVRALDLPRNLRSKRVFIDTNLGRVGLYHLNSFKELAEISKQLNDLSEIRITDTMSDEEIAIATENNDRYNSLLAAKKEKQSYIENVLLKGLAARNLNVLVNELPFAEPISDFEYVVYDDERITTNNYSNAFGIKDMNHSEIQQKGAKYFRDKLSSSKFADCTAVDYDYLLYSSDGRPTAVVLTDEFDGKELCEQVSPIVDDDGYRIDANNNKLYQWPSNSKLYRYKYGNIYLEVVVTDQVGLNELADSGNFVFYRSYDTIQKKNLYNINLQEAEVNEIFDRVAQKQYEAWLRSNDGIVARIPSQSLSFAMSMKTVGYLP